MDNNEMLKDEIRSMNGKLTVYRIVAVFFTIVFVYLLFSSLRYRSLAEKRIENLQSEIDNNNSSAYKEGQSSGYDDGYNSGYESGKSDGYEEGYNEAYWLAYDEGFDAGYDSCYQENGDAQSNYNDGYNDGYGAAYEDYLNGTISDYADD